MDAFRASLDECQLLEIEQQGLSLTWTNGQENENNVECKLDRYAATKNWLDLFPASKAEALPRIMSDHSPIICNIQSADLSLLKKRFRFEVMWTRHEDIEAQIAHGWRRPNNDVGISDRISACGGSLQNWDRNVFGNVRRNLRKLEEEIKRSQEAGITTITKSEIDSLLKRRDELLLREESLWAQRSRVIWLQEGDKNTRFFHQRASYRSNRNRVVKIKNSEGVEVKDEVGIQETFRNFFVSLFSSTGCTRLEDVATKISPRVSLDMNVTLDQPYTKEEIIQSIQGMHPTKAPGPDGMPPLFFQKYWHLVGDEVVKASLSILNDGSSPAAINDTIITLIPKVTHPTICAEFRPISLCNVMMKIVTKAITNRLKVLLPAIIHENQGAFVPGRLLTDNSLIALETYHFLKTKTTGKKGWCALKLDMMKAYDRIEWPFLEMMMRSLGFQESFIGLIMRCVSTVRYAIQLNGRVGEYFHPSRGLRQGDPLSPYLFLICAEGLGALIRHAEQVGLIHGIRVARSALPVTHLFFADDSLLFARASLDDIRNIVGVLSVYEAASGQKVNLQKSSITFSRNVQSHLTEQIRAELGTRLAEEGDVYLGLPTIIGRSKKAVFSSLEDRIMSKISGWKVRSLSKAGRETLIKAVLQAIPTFIMSSFLIPIDICDRIEKKLCDFFWGSANGEKKLHWRSWARHCRSKREGGLGFRRLHNFNRAMLAKQAWRLFTNPSSLTARVLQAKYYPRVSLLEAPLGNRPSHAWRSIREGISLLRYGLEWRVGNGQDIEIWHDRWIPDSELGHPKYMFPGSDALRFVSDLLLDSGHEWNLQLLHSLFQEDDVLRISRIHISPRPRPDLMRWGPSEDGIYNVRQGYHLDYSRWWQTQASSNSPVDFQWSQIWQLKCPPRFRNFLWRAIDNNLPVRENLYRRNILADSICPLCHADSETVQHLFLSCPRSRVWLSSAQINIQHYQNLPFQEACRNIIENSGTFEDRSRLVASLWAVWKARNLIVFENQENVNYQQELEKAVKLGTDYLHANQRQTSPCNDVQHRWRPPEADWFKINTDAGLAPVGGGQVAAVIRDSNGQFIAGALRRYPLINHPTLLEAYGCKAGIELAKELELTKVMLESDCQSVVNALIRQRIDRSDLSIIIGDCLAAAEQIEQVLFCFALRSANMVAHTMAKMPCLFSSYPLILFSEPAAIVDVMALDRL